MNCEKITEILESMRNIPYPELTCINANGRFVNMLYNTYSGMDGELTAILQYVYESIMFNNEEISGIMKKVVIDEMKHLDLLGNMLKKLGKPPVYQSGAGTLWSARNVNYVMRNVEEVMRNNIKAEEKAIREYKELMECTTDENIRNLIERIILDEKTHIEVFRRIIGDGD